MTHFSGTVHDVRVYMSVSIGTRTINKAKSAFFCSPENFVAAGKPFYSTESRQITACLFQLPFSGQQEGKDRTWCSTSSQRAVAPSLSVQIQVLPVQPAHVSDLNGSKQRTDTRIVSFKSFLKAWTGETILKKHHLCSRNMFCFSYFPSC